MIMMMMMIIIIIIKITEEIKKTDRKTQKLI